MYVNGMICCAIERVKGVHHTTVIYCVKWLGKQLPGALQESVISEVRELNELETFVGSKK